MRSLIRRLCIFSALLPVRIVMGSYYWCRYYLVEKPRSLKRPVVHTGTAQPTGLWCVCAINLVRGKTPPKAVSPNLLAFFDCLQRAGYNLIVVHNGDCPSQLINAMLPFCHSLLIRGRGSFDVGGYKVAVPYIAQLAPADEIKQVIFCNDSYFVKPSSFTVLLEKFKAMPDRYIGVVETFPWYHVGSWFYAIPGSVFNAEYFKTHWRRYRPTSNRRREIKVGEERLSQLLLKNGVFPHVWYKAESAIDRLMAMEQSELFEALAMYFCQGHLSGIHKDTLARYARIDERIIYSEIKKEIMARAVNLGAMVFWNLFLLKYDDIPFLKKDMVFKKACNILQIEAIIGHWEGEDAEYLEEILTYYKLRGDVRYSPFLTKLLYVSGYV